MTALIVIIALLVLVGLYVWSTQRNLVSLDEKMKNAFGQINVQLKTRWDAVTNLVEMTKQYAKHEHDTLTDVISKRRIDNASPEQIADQENAIQSVLSRLNAVAEAYPDLKANQMFADTMASIRQYEENVRLSRMVYNDSVTKMNMMSCSRTAKTGIPDTRNVSHFPRVPENVPYNIHRPPLFLS